MTGCSNCDQDGWTTPYQLENGLLVWTCDNCGNAKVENQSAKSDYEMIEVKRDEKGRFTN